MTRWFRVQSPADARLAEVAEALRKEELAIVPTDTVYGLAAIATNESAVRKIFHAKSRYQGKPLIVGAASEEQLARIVEAWPAQAQILADAFWPGPLSLVLPKLPEIPDLVSAGGSTVAVRIPSNEIILTLLRCTGPLVLTSANLAGMKEPLTAEEAFSQVGLHCAFVVDAGKAPNAKPSTVVDLTRSPPTIVREGVISAARIAEALN